MRGWSYSAWVVYCLDNSKRHNARQSSVWEPEVTRSVDVPLSVVQDEDGVWCAHAYLRPGVGVNGEGGTAEAAVEDLREALASVIAEFGSQDVFTVTVDLT